MGSSGPSIDRANSSGDIWTPKVFRQAVIEKFGMPVWDLAASSRSAFAPHWFDESENSLVQQWHGIEGLQWLNPPYSNITPWARKCSEESVLGAEILLLVPASVGSNWFWDFVEPFADVYSVGRMVFDNCFNKQGELVTTPYPKDLILAHYNFQSSRGLVYGPQKMQRWRWQQ